MAEREFCHCTGVPSPTLLKRLLKEEGGVRRDAGSLSPSAARAGRGRGESRPRRAAR